MRVEAHRATRFSFSATIELIDVQSERFVNGRTRDISVFGCYVSTATPFAVNTRVSLRIAYSGTALAAMGRVVSSKPKTGMGIVFTKLETSAQRTLENWLTALRST